MLKQQHPSHNASVPGTRTLVVLPTPQHQAPTQGQIHPRCTFKATPRQNNVFTFALGTLKSLFMWLYQQGLQQVEAGLP